VLKEEAGGEGYEKMKNLIRIISALITLKRVASVFLLLTALVVCPSAQEQREDSSRARTLRHP
jgi:hypothetical protein